MLDARNAGEMSETNLLAHEVSDAMLEAAAGSYCTAGSLSLAFCSGLTVCDTAEALNERVPLRDAAVPAPASSSRIQR